MRKFSQLNESKSNSLLTKLGTSEDEIKDICSDLTDEGYKIDIEVTYIGLDGHSKNCFFVVLNARGKFVRKEKIPTCESKILEFNLPIIITLIKYLPSDVNSPNEKIPPSLNFEMSLKTSALVILSGKSGKTSTWRFQDISKHTLT